MFRLYNAILASNVQNTGCKDSTLCRRVNKTKHKQKLLRCLPQLHNWVQQFSGCTRGIFINGQKYLIHGFQFRENF